MKTVTMRVPDVIYKIDRDLSNLTVETGSVAIVWVSDGISNMTEKQTLLTLVKRQTGIISAQFSVKIPLLMVVEYAPEHTPASAVVKTINGYGPGVRARLVRPRHGRLLPLRGVQPVRRLGGDSDVAIDSDLYARLCAVG